MRRVTALVLAGLLVLAACGGDDDDDGESVTGDETEDVSGDASDDLSDDASDEPADDADALTAPTAAEICAAVPAADVAEAVGVASAEATPGDMSTPQCQYAFETATGSLSIATVAAMRADEDLGGRTGEDAFDYVLEINRGIAGDDFEEVEVLVGDRAARLTGSSLHFGAVLVDGQVYTVIVPLDDATAEQADALVEAVAAGFGA